MGFLVLSGYSARQQASMMFTMSGSTEACSGAYTGKFILEYVCIDTRMSIYYDICECVHSYAHIRLCVCMYSKVPVMLDVRHGVVDQARH